MPISDGIAVLFRPALIAALIVAAGQARGEDPAPVHPGHEATTTGPAAEAILSIADDAAAEFSQIMGYVGGVSTDELLQVLEGAAQAGQPIAAWQLGVMYENGDGVEHDLARAFAYFQLIVDRYGHVPPQSVDADIVANTFVKLSQFYRVGVPGAGIAADKIQAQRLIAHAASYFGNSEAQYLLAQLYLDAGELGYSPVQSAYWLDASARKGHAAARALLPEIRFQAGETYLDANSPAYNPAESLKWFTSAAMSGHIGAQARLGALLFNGVGFDPAPVEGLKWLTVARRRSAGTENEAWITDLLEHALAIATPTQRQQALELADALTRELGG